MIAKVTTDFVCVKDEWINMANLRGLLSSDEDLILNWRNSSSVAPFMFSEHPISPSEHHLWFVQAKVDTESRHVRILEIEGIPSGLSTLSEIDHRSHVCEWGGYLSPDVSKGRGIGKLLMYLSLKYAFDVVQVNEVIVQVIVLNDVARGLYESLGFKEKQTFHGVVQKQNNYVDVLVMSLVRSDWNLKVESVASDLTAKGLLP